MDDLRSVPNVGSIGRSTGIVIIATAAPRGAAASSSSQCDTELSLSIQEVVGGSEGRVGEVDGGRMDEHTLQTSGACVVHHS